MRGRPRPPCWSWPKRADLCGVIAPRAFPEPRPTMTPKKERRLIHAIRHWLDSNCFALGREMRTTLGLLDQAAMDRRAGELLAQLECHIRPEQPVGELRVGDDVQLVVHPLPGYVGGNPR